MPAAAVVSDFRRHPGMHGITLHIVGGVVEHSVNNNLDAVFLSLGTHGLELSLCTESVAVIVLDIKCNGLINHPALIHQGTPRLAGRFFDGLNGRSLDCGKALSRNFRKHCFDVVKRPAPALENLAVLNIFAKSVGRSCRFGKAYVCTCGIQVNCCGGYTEPQSQS